MQGILLKFQNKKRKKKLLLKSNFNKINKNFKKYIKITNLMSFIKKFNNQSVKPKELLTNIKQFYKKRKNKPTE